MGDGDTYNIHLHGITDSLGAAREVEKLLIRLKRETGRPLAFN